MYNCEDLEACASPQNGLHLRSIIQVNASRPKQRAQSQREISQRDRGRAHQQKILRKSRRAEKCI